MKQTSNIGFDLLLGGLFGALAIVLPFLFHLIGAGTILLPMFLPIVALAFLADYRVVLSVAVLCPLVSWVITGGTMPPLMPPIMPIMILELILISALIFILYQVYHIDIYLVLILIALVDRVLLFFLFLLLGNLLVKYAQAFSLIVVLHGLPGFVLQFILVPPIVKYLEPRITEMRQIG